MNTNILFRVTRGKVHRVFVWTDNREAAKRLSHSWLGGDMETYEVEPMTNMGDTVHLITYLNV